MRPESEDSDVLTISRFVAQEAREAGVVVRFQRRMRRSLLTVASAALIGPLLGGCANTLEDITSHRYRDKLWDSPFHTLFSSDDPMYVLRNAKEADDRAKAMLVVKEPKARKGSDADQEELIAILEKSATSDMHSVCRINAIEALSRFQDPRASRILLAAYHNAGNESPAGIDPVQGHGVVQAVRKTRTFEPAPSFSQDQVGTIQCRALESLGKKQSPDALELLCEIASTPIKMPARATDLDALTQENSALEQFDLRLAAIRALGNYKGNQRAAQVLYRIAATEKKDVAPRDRAYLCLVQVTDKDYPWDSPEWPKFLKMESLVPPKAAPTTSDKSTTTQAAASVPGQNRPPGGQSPQGPTGAAMLSRPLAPMSQPGQLNPTPTGAIAPIQNPAAIPIQPALLPAFPAAGPGAPAIIQQPSNTPGPPLMNPSTGDLR
jgi:hypothetical protein